MTEKPMPGPELDALACEAMGIPPRIIWILTNDGGKTECFHSDRRSACVAVLEDHKRSHPNSWLAECEVSSWKQYPRVSEDPGAMMCCWNWLNQQGFDVQVVTHSADSPTWCQPYVALEPARRDVVLRRVRFNGDTPAHALALAVLDVSAVLKTVAALKEKEAVSGA